MERKILMKVKGIENENLRRIEEVREAIRIINKFARDMGRLDGYFSITSICENVELCGDKKEENGLYFAITVETGMLEEIMANVKDLAEKLNTELKKIDRAIIMGLEKAPAKEDGC